MSDHVGSGGRIWDFIQSAAEGVQPGSSEATLLVQLALLLLVGRLLGEAMQRLGQPAVMGHLLAGMVLGPSRPLCPEIAGVGTKLQSRRPKQSNETNVVPAI